MKKLKWYLLSSLIPLFFPVFIIIIIMGPVGGGSTGGSSQSLNGATYTDHWSNGDPYTHNLLVHRYGIKAEQLDGFLDTLGISYDKKRINGKKLLDWEAKSNLDVRAIVAIALNESSLGTAGVATNPGSNMFGFGAFDSNPENANNFNDEVAVVGLTNQTIIGNKNETFKVQDDKAQKFASGSLNTSTDGGVYFTIPLALGKGVLKPCKNSILISMSMEAHQRPLNKRQEKPETEAVSQQGMSHKAIASPKKSIPQATQDCLILGDNVPGLSITEEKKSVLASESIWEMVANG